MMNTVEAHRSGFWAMAAILDAMNSAPAAGRNEGCSELTDGGKIQLTAGSVPLKQSSSKLVVRSKGCPVYGLVMLVSCPPSVFPVFPETAGPPPHRVLP